MYSKDKRLSLFITLNITFKYTKNKKCESRHQFHFSLKMGLELPLREQYGRRTTWNGHKSYMKVILNFHCVMSETFLL